jgi:hypothetical protein
VKYVKICNAISVGFKAYNIYNVPALRLACRLEHYNALVKHWNVDSLRVMYTYNTRDGNTKVLTGMAVGWTGCSRTCCYGSGS